MFSECKCNPNGSTTMECDGVNGNCICKEGFTGTKCNECKPRITGDKCDTCESTFFNYPSCKGMFVWERISHGPISLKIVGVLATFVEFIN